jgi:RimJ/RimL family protein N-acetyltransferase
MSTLEKIIIEKEQPITGEIKNKIDRITTPNLLIRSYKIEDAEELIEAVRENKDYMLPWIPWAKDEPESLNAKRERILKWERNRRLGIKYFAYGIFTHDEKMIGTVYLFTRGLTNQIEIGYWIDRNQAGKGYASECTYAITKLIFNHMDIEKVEIRCDLKNYPSAKIPYRLGYTNEYNKRKFQKDEFGVRRIQMVWVMFEEEFVEIDKYEPVRFYKEE